MGERSKKTLIIAEAGVNHNGSLEIAKQLADAAKESGADIVKYQVFKADKLATGKAAKAEYQVAAGPEEESQVDMLKKLELSFDSFRELKSYCDSIGIEFLATSFDRESTVFLVEELGIALFKIPSGEMDNYPYLVQAASSGLPIVMSTGMSTMDEIEASVRVLKEHGATDITLLHCNTQYPTPYQDVNLKAMPLIGETFGTAFGYSDHTPGIEVPIAAVALGASVIEKHFTLDREMEGPDHKASLEPSELKAMVDAIRNVELSLGEASKGVTSSEAGNRAVARKSIVAAKRIEAGELFTEDNLTTMRPGTGLSPMRWPDVIGRTAKRAFEPGEEVEL